MSRTATPASTLVPLLALATIAFSAAAVLHDDRSGSSDAPVPAAKAVDPLRDRGVPTETRRKALAAAATASGKAELDELIDAIERCGECAASRDLGVMLGEWDASALAAAPIMSRLVSIAGSEVPEPVRVAAARGINAVPEAQRPESARRFAATKVEIVCVPGQMRWEPKEFSVPAGVVVEIRMRNDDSMQHNLLVVAPGALSEIGVAGDRMGETPEGKAREFVPESPKVLHVMGLIDPGVTGTLWFMAPTKPATYPLVCTYPGHWRMMNGKMKVTKPAE